MVSRIEQAVLQIDADLERARRNGIVELCLAAEQAAALPRGLLLAVASRESGCRNIVGLERARLAAEPGAARGRGSAPVARVDGVAGPQVWRPLLAR